MKMLKTIGAIIVITGAIIGIVIAQKNIPGLAPETQLDVENPISLIPQNQELCFSRNFNGDITEAKLIVSGENVTGTFNWIPFEKDSARGTVTGTIGENGEMNLLYDYMIEGAHQTEEKIMKIQNGKLLIRHGELIDPKYDGHLVYKDVGTAIYSETLEPCTK